MIFDISNFDQIKKYALILEQKNFSEIEAFIHQLPKQEFYLFWSFVYGSEIFGEISSHKISLANFLAKQNNVKVLSEDATRIVFTIAAHYKEGLTTINQALEQEAGPNLIVKEKYNTKKGLMSWQKICKRAFEIRNGIQSHAYLSVQKNVKDVITYYKINNNNDQNELTNLYNISMKILKNFVSKRGADLMTTFSDESMNDIKLFYQKTNHLKLNIENLEEKKFDEIISYVVTMKNVFQTKLHLISKNIQVTDLIMAEKYIINMMIKKEMDSYLSFEEIARIGVKLEKNS